MVLQWLERLPAAELKKRPKLRLAAAWALALSERHGEAEALVRDILDDPARAAALSEQARRYALTWSSVLMATRLAELYREVISTHVSATAPGATAAAHQVPHPGSGS